MGGYKILKSMNSPSVIKPHKKQNKRRERKGTEEAHHFAIAFSWQKGMEWMTKALGLSALSRFPEDLTTQVNGPRFT